MLTLPVKGESIWRKGSRESKECVKRLCQKSASYQSKSNAVVTTEELLLSIISELRYKSLENIRVEIVILK